MSSGFGLVECDGVSPPLFHLMWHKDELECGVQNVAIPDTIVYRHRQAAGWYFTSRDGTIKRKNKANTSNAKIEVRGVAARLYCVRHCEMNAHAGIVYCLQADGL